MAFADPQVITYAGDATDFVRLPSVGSAGVFYADGLNAKLTISTQEGKRKRTTARLVHQESVNADGSPNSVTVYIVVDRQAVNAPALVNQKAAVDALCDWLQSSTNTVRLLGGEA